MALFPTSLIIEGKIDHITDREAVPDTFLEKINCDGKELLYFPYTEKEGNEFDRLDERYKYNMIISHLIIPEYFQKVKFRITEEQGTGLFVMHDVEELVPLESFRGYNGLFATSIDSVFAFQSEEFDDDFFSRGKFNCAFSAHSFVNQRSNVDQLFFKFRNHFFYPIILSNGDTCYYAFESKDIAEDLLYKLSSGAGKLIAVDTAIEFNNILGIKFTRDIRVV